ncbi:unnamed protein product [Vicia faba]|uniref:Uncharacterized protein n=1 Tax=Vicia faba TaxID=3906 RepID=A0AAV0YY77_VICFA|nr:unnamed protein product [Vicia faba]
MQGASHCATLVVHLLGEANGEGFAERHLLRHFTRFKSSDSVVWDGQEVVYMMKTSPLSFKHDKSLSGSLFVACEIMVSSMLVELYGHDRGNVNRQLSFVVTGFDWE